MLKNKKITFFVFLAVVVVFIALGIWIGLSLVASHSDDANAPSAYTAVYMTSGDIYFGKLSRFPSLHLTDTWYLERGTGADGQPQVGVAPLTSAFWGPVGDIDINPQNVLFYAPLKNGSGLVQTIENQSSAQPQVGAQILPATSTTQ